MLSQIYSVYKKLVGKVGSQWFSWHLVKFGIWGCWLESFRGGGGGHCIVSLSGTFYLLLCVGRKISSYMNERLFNGM